MICFNLSLILCLLLAFSLKNKNYLIFFIFSFVNCILFFRLNLTSTIFFLGLFNLIIFPIRYCCKKLFYKLLNKNKSTKLYSVFELIVFIFEFLFSIILIINLSNLFLKNYFYEYNPLIIKLLLISICFIFISFFSSKLIGFIFNIIYNKGYEKKLKIVILSNIVNSKEKAITSYFDKLGLGKTIGILERSLLFFSILTFSFKNSTAIISGLIALKALTRFKLMEIKIFSEYYLIGTLLSFLFAISPFIFLHFIPNKILFIKKIFDLLLFI